MYQLTNTGEVRIVETGACIPADATNSDWRDYQHWLSEGNMPEPVADPASVVPQEVTKRQAVQALILAGLDGQVDALLDAMPGIDGQLARAEWRESNTVNRNRPLVLQMASALNLSASDLDALFVQAAAL